MKDKKDKSGLHLCSVLMAVYDGDSPEYFSMAIDSILGQSLKSDDIVIVQDGAVRKELRDVLLDYSKKHSDVITLVTREANGGLAAALNDGIKICKHELVARADADDVSAKNRFELQVNEFNSRPALDIISGNVAEFEEDIENVSAYRNVPTTKNEIAKFARRGRSPLNHPAVMYRKTSIVELNGYDESNKRNEDFSLWMNALAKGFELGNVDEVVLFYRVGEESYRRKASWQQTKDFIKSRNEARRIGIMSRRNVWVACGAQILLFVMPVGFAKFFYRKVLRR